MDSMVMQRRVVLRAGHQRARSRAGERAGWLAFAAAVVMLLALLPVLAGTAGSTPVDPPGPLAAPAPGLDTGMDFPERARPWGACSALVEHSAALDNARSDRANELTFVLYQDACLGA